ncbi:MAG: class A beta-lactamase [Candidatus Palauibacterales bacterium]|nr:class A beta-lactamase [Candidatus Palauibacterales bacterium]
MRHQLAGVGLVAICALLGGPVGDAEAQAFDPGPSPACVVPDSLTRALERIARRVGSDIGIGALHMESGMTASFNGHVRFPMASVSKVPIALAFLRRVDLGEVSLDGRLRVPITDFRPGNSPLASWSGGRPVTVSVDSLFKLMITVSDNTATDVILRMAGGPEAVTRRLRELGIEEIDVDRSEARTFADLVGIPDTVPEGELYRYSHFRMRDALPDSVRQQARLAYGTDSRDTATPDATARLLAAVWEGAGLSPGSRDLLIRRMEESRSGPRRIRGLLPRGTPVAHKTGTMAGAINDVGIVSLPEGAGHLAIAVYVNTLYRTTFRRERTIAQASRALYDYFSEAAVAGPLAAAACAHGQPRMMTPAGG